MSQHDFNIANQSFPATRADLNNSLVALASNSSGDAEPTTTYANQWWYETDSNTLKLRNEANTAWVPICILDQGNNNVLSITTQGLTLGATTITASGTEINQLDNITRGSLIYGNASGVTSRLAAGAASTVLTSDGTDISWAAGGGGGGETITFPSDWASPTNTYSTSGTWSKGSLADDDYVWIYLLGGGGGGGHATSSVNASRGGNGGNAFLIYGKAGVLNGGAYVIGAAKAGETAINGSAGNASTFTLTALNGGTVYTTASADSASTWESGEANALVLGAVSDVIDLASFDDYTVIGLTIPSFSFVDLALPTGVLFRFGSPGKTNVVAPDEGHTIFGGGGGGSSGSGKAAGNTSEFSGAGGAASTTTSATNGIYPGGGGGGSLLGGGSSAGGIGAAGNMRVYHV